MPSVLLLLCGCALALATVMASAAPFTPGRDDEVVERLPLRRGQPEAAQLAGLRAAWRADPRDPARAAALAEAYTRLTAADGDPRWMGHAQAVLAPWWDAAEPPPAVRLQRAVLRQFNHGFDDARADLQAVLRAEPDHAAAWAWRVALDLVQARYDGAREACARLGAVAPGLAAAGCAAQVDGLTGRTAEGAARLRRALADDAAAPPALRLWALTRLAEMEARRGAVAEAQAAFDQALALNLRDTYLQAAHADFLLDEGRAAEVLTRLRDQGRADALLLRLALAAQATGSPRLPELRRELAARFDAARQRGDTTHEKEEARFALELLRDAPRALALAQRNYALQREPADARVLLEAALAARQPAAAEPALRWLADSGIEDTRLQALAGRLRALR
ncbi:hypothetical protein [Aquabacterium sp. J223]|uniref:hypothetical protein n=1 Tax=Aquabacterium sp. J223 TaxID=2898431 RepID=UPI0021ADA944|nr:hypothetical protein [Aquabacterium sp. J223]UUX95743.1 hypothetical protein LRS07_21555 [Aquabacterium sp. J223]